jgi:hypothetical protein
MFLIRPEFLACHKSFLLPGFDSSLATISVKMAPISDVRKAVFRALRPQPSEHIGHR